MRRGAAALVLALALALCAAPARAQTADASLVTRAAQEVERGNRLFQQQRYPDAARAFEAADALVASAVAQQNAGAAWERAGERARAADAYAAALAAGTLDAEFSTDTRRRLAKLERELGVLVVAEPSGGTVEVAHASGRVVPARVHLAPGSYEVAVRAPGGEAVVRRVSVQAAAVTELRVRPEPLPTSAPARTAAPASAPPPEAPRHTTRLLGWVGVGVGVAGAALGGAFAGRYLSLRSDYLDRPGQSLHDEAAGWQTASTATFYPSLAVLAIGVVLVAGSGGAAKPTASPRTPLVVARW